MLHSLCASILLFGIILNSVVAHDFSMFGLFRKHQHTTELPPLERNAPSIPSFASIVSTADAEIQLAHSHLPSSPSDDDLNALLVSVSESLHTASTDLDALEGQAADVIYASAEGDGLQVSLPQEARALASLIYTLAPVLHPASQSDTPSVYTELDGIVEQFNDFLFTANVVIPNLLEFTNPLLRAAGPAMRTLGIDPSY